MAHDEHAEPLLQPEQDHAPRLRRDSWAAEAPPGLIAYEREHSGLYEAGAHWLQVRLARDDGRGFLSAIFV